jgi:pantothenate synthetase
MWEQLNGRSRSTAENHIEEYNESIVKEIVNGDLELSNRMIELKNVRNKHSIEMSVRDEILKRAEREKS